jgi:very-short-patch-repair endonuclease
LSTHDFPTQVDLVCYRSFNLVSITFTLHFFRIDYRMQEIILARLEASRKELLDLGMRNPLLNYKTPKPRGLHIVEEKSSFLYDILVRQAKSMTFLGRKTKTGDGTQLEIPELIQPNQLEFYADTKLQTNEPDDKLQSKILNTYYFARTSIEEQGVNILYLSLGMLNWYELGNATDIRQAPLILIPATLERSSAQERFRLRYIAGAEVGTNLSLQAKMQVDFNITIPSLPEVEELDIETYLKDIAGRVAHHPTWKVEPDAVELGFFSFGKFMIYNDLDSEKWPAAAKPHQHTLLQSLFGEGFKDSQPTATEAHHIDHHTQANSLFQVVDADSSQVLAMLAVHEGRNMVIQGPPGTGKSQTITNIIANAIGNGKKVLFVAEKLAALDVVKRRLDAIGLGEACLALHSHKANKKELHDELKRTLDLGKPTLKHLEQEISLLDGYRQELNDYCDAINKIENNSNIPTQKVIGFLLKIDIQTQGVQLPVIDIPQISNWDAGQMSRAEAMAERIQARLIDIGIPSSLLFWGSKLKVLLPQAQELLRKTLEKAVEATSDLQQQANGVTAHLKLPEVINELDSVKLVSLLQLASQNPGTHGLDIFNGGWLQHRIDIKECVEAGQRINEIQHQYKDIFIPEAWQQNMLEIRQNLLAYGGKWYKFIIGDYRKSNKQLAALCKMPLPDDLNVKLQYVDAISEVRRLQNEFKEMEQTVAPLFGSRWQKQRSDWMYLANAAEYIALVKTQINDGVQPKQLLDYLAAGESVSWSLDNATALQQKLAAQQLAVKAVVADLALDQYIKFPGSSLQQLPFQQQIAIVTNWINNLPEIHHSIAWNNLSETAESEKLGFLISASTHWPEAKNQLKTALQKTWYSYLMEQAMNSAALRKFERASHEEVIEKFKKLDVLNQQYNRALVALKHYEGIPKQDAGGQVNILKSEFNKKARHMPIRKLMQEAGLAVQAIKPVFMMGPMSIANFLHPGSLHFDMVIFDEASQVRPVEALGAMLRGKQLVVVGDTKQLPPTSFFDKMNSDTDDDENVTADMQSILGMCDSQGAPERMLRWHYRSRHESLISLSNQQFYENRLVIFPSPGSKHRLGLSFHYLPNAFYDRGKTRSNPIEAEAVAAAVIEHAIKTPKMTLGVVAFSTAQMQAIQTALETKRRQHPESEGFFGRHPNEPFFVKNLENVQGDERDVIYISIGYGRTEDGKVPMSFGPLNNEGGERRLNVLITRAKRRCEVFANITSDDIKATETSKFGIRALKSFLYFAQHGRLDRMSAITTTSPTPFEDLVAEKLEAAGYIVRKKVGSAGFFLDLAVVDDKHPGRYLLGIECDGETYAGAKSARDRDRLWHQVLEGIGWMTYRLWSADWFRNPERELKRLLEAIDHAKELVNQIEDEEEEIATEGVVLEPTGNELLQREEIVVETVSLPAYKMVELPAEIATKELHLHPLSKMALWIAKVVKVEGPVHFEEAARRILKAGNVSQLGSRIRESLTRAALQAQEVGHVKIVGDFLWHPQMIEPVVRDRSELPTSSRKLQYIAPEELYFAIQQIVGSSIAIQPEAAVPFVAKMFGFGRVTEDLRNDLLTIIQQSVDKGFVKKEGGLLKMK